MDCVSDIAKNNSIRFTQKFQAQKCVLCEMNKPGQKWVDPFLSLIKPSSLHHLLTPIKEIVFLELHVL